MTTTELTTELTTEHTTEHTTEQTAEQTTEQTKELENLTIPPGDTFLHNNDLFNLNWQRRRTDDPTRYQRNHQAPQLLPSAEQDILRPYSKAPQLKEGDAIRFPDKSVKFVPKRTTISESNETRSYILESSGQHYWRNRQHLLKVQEEPQETDAEVDWWAKLYNPVPGEIGKEPEQEPVPIQEQPQPHEFTGDRDMGAILIKPPDRLNLWDYCMDCLSFIFRLIQRPERDRLPLV